MFDNIFLVKIFSLKAFLGDHISNVSSKKHFK